jgi:hypothetical protein
VTSAVTPFNYLANMPIKKLRHMMALFNSVERADGRVVDQDALARRRANIARRLARLCQACGERVAQFADPGETEPDGAPTLCLPCLRAKGHPLPHPHPHPHLQPAPTTAPAARADRFTEVEDTIELSGAQPQAAKDVVDRDELYTNLSLRRRRAQIAARQASEAEPVESPAQLDKAS